MKMSKKEKTPKISVTELDKALAVSNGTETPYNETTTVAWNGVNIVVKKLIPVEEMIQFVLRGTNLCYNTETGEYMPELSDFMFRALFFEYYTNITTSTNVNKMYVEVMNDDLYNTVRPYVSGTQIADIVRGIDERIKLHNKLNVTRAEQELEKTLEDVTKVLDGLKQLSDSVSAEDVRNMFDAFSDSKIDEKKLVEAVQSSIIARKKAEEEERKKETEGNTVPVNLFATPPNLNKKPSKQMNKVDTAGLETPRGI